MKHAKSIFLVLLLFPSYLFAQFGPKKKELQLGIDSLKSIIVEQNLKIDYLNEKDSVNSIDTKRFSNELKDLKEYLFDINEKLERIKLENENFSKDNVRLKKQYDDLIKKVEIHQILIRNVIGVDSLEQFEKKIEKENSIDNSQQIELKNFNLFATEFIKQIKQNGEAGLKNYFNPQKPFYYLSKPGFITSVAEIKDVNELIEEIPWRIGFEAFKKSKYSLVEGDKPTINCEMADFYNKRGCYAGPENNFEKISKALTIMKEFNPDEAIKMNQQIIDIKTQEPFVKAFILSTDGNLGFYFIKSEGGWQLFCLEIEDPCSA